jgi:DNA polymerase-3 subunit epsilon
MREIVFDTETTGLDAREDRIIEIGAIELVNRFPTGRVFHHYLNPQGRSIHADALDVHGISYAQLLDKPTFEAISTDFLNFIDGARLVAHNAGFDMSFVNAELARLGQPAVDPGLVIDTLALAKRKHPMGPNSLDALCRRYGIDNSHRAKHGALLDSELLAEVYVELNGGKQAALSLEIVVQPTPGKLQGGGAALVIEPRRRPLPPRLNEEERAAHSALVSELGHKAIWNRISDRAIP